MSSQQNTPQQKEPANNGQPERFNPKVLLIFLVIISAIIGLWFAQPGAGANHERLTISELVQAVKDGQIEPGDGVMKPDPSLGEAGYIVAGKMLNPKYDANLSDASVPEKVQFSAEGRLLEKDFDLVRAVLKESRRSTAFQDILISFPAVSADYWPALFPLRAPIEERREGRDEFW